MGLVLGVAGSYHDFIYGNYVQEELYKYVLELCDNGLSEIKIGLTGNLELRILDIYEELIDKGNRIALKLVTTDSLIEKIREVDLGRTSKKLLKELFNDADTEHIKCKNKISEEQYSLRIIKIYQDSDVFIYNSACSGSGALIDVIVNILHTDNKEVLDLKHYHSQLPTAKGWMN